MKVRSYKEKVGGEGAGEGRSQLWELRQVKHEDRGLPCY